MSELRHIHLLDATNAVLLVVDVQERFRAAIAGFADLVASCVRLVKTFRALDLPVLATEQYPKGLGKTVPELSAALGPAPVPEKTAFSSLGCAATRDALRDGGPTAVLVCGIETHVCISQSVHDLLADGYTVHVAVDGVSSRHAIDHTTALAKMQRAGAVLTTCEMAAFELLSDARHPKFKEVQSLFK